MGARPVRVLVIIAALAAGCGSNPSSPSAVPLLPDVYRFECGGWRPSVPPIARTVIDVTVPPESVVPGSIDNAIRALEQGGARHRYTFHGPRIRMEMDVVQVAASQFVNNQVVVRWASTVPAPTDYRVPVLIFYTRVFTEFDAARLESLGGVVTGVTNSAASAIVTATVDDAKLPEVRRLPDVSAADISDLPTCNGL